LLQLLLLLLLMPRGDLGFAGVFVGKHDGLGRPCAVGTGVQLSGLGIREAGLLLVLLMGQAGGGGMRDGDLVDGGVVGHLLGGVTCRGVPGEQAL
jgi:hypothetical protein